MMLAAGVMTGCQVADGDLGAESTSTGNAATSIKEGYGLLSVNVGDWESSIVSAKSDIASRAGVDYTSQGVYHISFKVFKGTASSIGEAGWGEAIYSTTQFRDDSGFGTISCQLPAGKHTIVATANSGSESDFGSVDITSPDLATSPQNNFCRTWADVKEVTIASGQENQLSMTLPRACAQLVIENSTAVTSNAKSVRFSIGDTSKDAFEKVIFNPNTGYALGKDEGGADCYTYTAAASNTYTLSIPVWKIASNTDATDTDKVIMPIKIDVLDADGNVICDHPVFNAPFKLGYKTTCSGSLYKVDSSGTFMFEDLQTDESLNTTF